MTIINLAEARAAKDAHDGPWLEGKVLCLNCGHRWHQVAQPGDAGIDCPECKLAKGIWINLAACKDEEHYTCRCKNQFFHITPQRIYCPCCGLDHRPFE